jgi:hypothetical protein
MAGMGRRQQRQGHRGAGASGGDRNGHLHHPLIPARDAQERGEAETAWIVRMSSNAKAETEVGAGPES